MSENQPDPIDVKMQEWQQDIQLAIYWRGRVLESVISLELAMNLYLAQYFCGTNDAKVNSIITYIFGDERMSLRSKLDVFGDIAKKYDTKWFTSYKGEKNMKKDLLDVMEERNIFAHRLMDRESFSEVHAPAGTLRFLVFKNDIGNIDYTVGDCEKLIQKINRIADYIHDRVLKPPPDSASVHSSEPSTGA